MVFFSFIIFILLFCNSIKYKLNFSISSFNHRYNNSFHSIEYSSKSWRCFNSIEFNFSNNYGKKLLQFFLYLKQNKRNKIAVSFLSFSAAIQIDETSQTVQKIINFFVLRCSVCSVHNQMKYGCKIVRQ